MPSAQREHSLLAQVLDWNFNTQTLEQDFNAWETVKVRYETLTGTSLPDGALIATLLNKTSGSLQQHLRLNSTSIRMFAQMREVIISYFKSRLMLQNTASTSQGPAPIDIGALKGKGYFKGGKKGKSKGFVPKGMKGGKSGFGHWNFMKGKSKQGKGGFKNKLQRIRKRKRKGQRFFERNSRKEFHGCLLDMRSDWSHF